jgi:hypothetical protein
MRKFTIKIASGAVGYLNAKGDYIRIRSASVTVNIRSEESDEYVELDQGDEAYLTPFKVLQLSHADAAEQTFIVYIGGNGTRAGSSKVGGSVTISGLQGAHAWANPTVTTAAANVFAANTARRFLLIQNNHATGNVYARWDGTAATVATGKLIPPGGELVLDAYAPTSAVSLIGDVASNAAVVAVQG